MFSLTNLSGIARFHSTHYTTFLLTHIKGIPYNNNMNVQAHIDYWLSMAQDDIEAADILLENKKFWQALFYAHLSLEKTLKAHVTHATKDIPPKTHNLLRLAEIASLAIAPNQRDFLIRFDTYNIEGRYPGEQKPKTTKVEAQKLLDDVKEMREWLKNLF